jgi:hypothetical protein
MNHTYKKIIIYKMMDKPIMIEICLFVQLLGIYIFIYLSFPIQS